MIPTSARLLRVLSLLQSRREWTGAALAERLEITERTVRRDIDKLRTLGYPVHSSAGVAGGYRLGAGAELPPLLLDDDEALAVAIGLRSAASGSITGIEEIALRALTKLEQVLPTRLQRRVRALHASVITLDPNVPRVDPVVLSTLASACRDRTRARFDYSTADKRHATRAVEPYGLVHVQHHWYLVAWDVDREAWRTFRVDRIAGRVTVGLSFVARALPDRDLATFVSRSVSQGAYGTKASIVLHISREELQRRISPRAALLEAIGPDRCRMHTGGHSVDQLAGFLAMLGVEFEVESPSELVSRLTEVTKLLRRGVARSDVARVRQHSPAVEHRG